MALFLDLVNGQSNLKNVFIKDEISPLLLLFLDCCFCFTPNLSETQAIIFEENYKFYECL